MSSIYPGPTNNVSPLLSQPPPTHHLHRDSEALPIEKDTKYPPSPYGGSSSQPQQTWSKGKDVADRPHTVGRTYPTSSRPGDPGNDLNPRNGVTPPKHPDAFNEDRSMGVKPTAHGSGVGIGGNSDLPEGHATFMDKAIGKVQKITGKVTNDPELHEKGELRESGGKQAVLGNARAPHN